MTSMEAFRRLLDSLVLPFLPDWLTHRLRTMRQAFRQSSTRDVFREVYAKRRWGPDEFDSGCGSYGEPARVFAECVIKYVVEHQIKTVADLGCGNFAVGQLIAPRCEHYIGVDIVPELIEHNRKRFPNIDFRCLDIVTEKLPDADLCMVRQVMQHMSNGQIVRLLDKLRQYRHVIVAEHYPLVEGEPNMDIAAGPGTRHLQFGSGVYLDKPPFQVPSVQLLGEASLGALGTLRVFNISFVTS